MESHAIQRALLPDGWLNVLDRVQEALTVAEAAAARRERSLPAFAPPEDISTGQTVSWRLCLERLRQRLDGLAACAERARLEIADAESAVTEGADSLQGWLAQYQSVAQALAARTAVSVG